MALKYKVPSLEGLDESLHSLYTKTDDGYTLGVDGLEDVSGLKSALSKERDANKEFKTQLTDLQKSRDAAETKTLEEQGKYKDLFEKQKTETLQSQTDHNALIAEVANGKRDALVNQLALGMTTDKDEIDIISRFATDFVKLEGKEASFSKPVDELKTELSRFVRSKASGTGDKGNNNGSGDAKTMERTEFAKLDTAGQSKFMNDGGSLTD